MSVPVRKSAIIFTLAGTLAVVILMGLRLLARIIAQCKRIVTEPAKALKLLAPQLKNRFTSCASFPREHLSAKAIRGPRLRIPARHLRPHMLEYDPHRTIDGPSRAENRVGHQGSL
jgi:hypothetical protein